MAATAIRNRTGKEMALLASLKEGEYFYTELEPRTIKMYAPRLKIVTKTETCLLVRQKTMEVVRVTRVEIVKAGK